MLLSLPLGVGAAVYLEEYAPKNFLTTLLELNIANLAGVPSVVYGLLGLGVICSALWSRPYCPGGVYDDGSSDSAGHHCCGKGSDSGGPQFFCGRRPMA